MIGICTLHSCKVKSSIGIRNGQIHAQDFNAIPNDGKEDTEAVQAMIDFLIENKSVNTIFFSEGQYLLNSVKLTTGITIKGEEGTIFKKMPKAGKWSRMLHAPAKGKYRYSSDKDSGLLTIKNIKFDGNSLNQGAYDNHELEQQHLIFLAADPNHKGRLNAHIENCDFKNSVADGISIWCNVNVRIEKCSAENVFRGGITITGGYTKVVVNDFEAKGDKHLTGIDIEVDGKGYGESYYVDVQIDNMQLAGDFDVAIREGIFTGNNIHVDNPPFRIGAKNGKVNINNSSFYGGKLTQSAIYFPKDVTFENCKFFLDEKIGKKTSAVNVVWSTSYVEGKKQRLRFKNCEFKTDNEESVPESYAIYCYPDILSRDNKILLENCTIEKGFQYGLSLKQGGKLSINKSTIASDIGVKLNGIKTAQKSYFYEADITDTNFEKSKTPIKAQNKVGSKLKSLGGKYPQNFKLNAVQN